MPKERIAYDHLMNLLDQVATRLSSEHAFAQDFGTGVLLYRAEIHTIQAVGQNPGINMSELAQIMNVTKGAESQMVSKLERKGLVRKSRIGADNREVILFLTDLGWQGYYNHEASHTKIYQTVRQYFGSKFNSRIKTFTSALTELNDIMDILGKQSEDE